jgi:hypothetical protein
VGRYKSAWGRIFAGSYACYRAQDMREDLSQDGRQDGRQDGPGRGALRLTVPQAAERLGITQDAVRKRVKRGYIEWDKDDGGRLYVWVDPTETLKETSSSTSSGTSGETSGETSQDVNEDVLLDYVQTLKDRIRHLEEESRRKDHLLAAALERIPAIEEAPSEMRDGHETASEKPSKAEVPPEQEKRSWWRRLFE